MFFHRHAESTFLNFLKVCFTFVKLGHCGRDIFGFSAFLDSHYSRKKLIFTQKTSQKTPLIANKMAKTFLHFIFLQF